MNSSSNWRGKINEGWNHTEKYAKSGTKKRDPDQHTRTVHIFVSNVMFNQSARNVVAGVYVIMVLKKNMTEHRKLIGYVPAGLLIIFGMAIAMIETQYVMDSAEHGIVSSCYTTIAVFVPVFSFVFCGIGIAIITTKLTWDFVLGAGIFFSVSIMSFPVFFDMINICSMIGLG